MTVTPQNQQRAVAALKAHLPADRVLTAGPEYAAGTALWNGAVASRPAILPRYTSTAEVQTGVRAARELGLPLSVRGGGHDWAGRALSDQGLTLDLTPMSSGHVDVEAAGRPLPEGPGRTMCSPPPTRTAWSPPPAPSAPWAWPDRPCAAEVATSAW
ncbi:hypothetical protein GCM10017744_007140 [Streptomyces antimycoticus]|uniref:FAD linked oxidase N-terminal domain-containing protein n=2 Tax=Streptomyces antimycoticus TaxID=68175 RepID=A0A4D4KRC1_9ACTN|nr:hypothetical protein SANT12839_092850 [Streptomyces antimycoticus]